MKNIIYFLIFLSIAFSCKDEQNEIIQEIAPIDGKWIKGEITYWITTEEDGIWTEIKPNDTLKYSRYEKCTEFKLAVNNNLSIEKLVLIDPLTETKISETVEYSKRINENLETLISLRYDYKSDRYFSYIIDSIGTEKKRNINKVKLDSMYKYAEKHGLYLCGTAADEILKEGIPEFPIPREISLDSTIFIINEWKNTSL
ncbi:hypothetical protein [uncultured Aquimarina sp.]|uniref:hypothetical protein n=1 Tax=uncultured Aquimarina sp. TaxID=575652 RepID=UPI0026024454|nr:hypothetical protein [uncultured Aquimarina sp.]